MGECKICGGKSHRVIYQGDIRSGAFGSVREDAEISECETCGVQRLAESCCLPDSHYETEAYRKKLQQALDGESYYRVHDEQQEHWLRALRRLEIRGKSLADVGCGAGSFVDHISGLVSEVIAIEPFQMYQKILVDKGYKAYPYAKSAAADGVKVDCAVSFQVIEHVSDPVAFLSETRGIMKDDGILVVSTPNQNDILMTLLPEDYPAFFYRDVHRWYFDQASLETCAKRAGFEVDSVSFIHRFGLSNTLFWLKHRAPKGRVRADGIDEVIDSNWVSYLEDRGKADTLVVVLRAC